MLIFKRASDIRKYLQKQASNGIAIGFVPTMGALHPGHISLVTKARAETNCVVCSIFVNPTQFNDPEDYQKYPVAIEQDIYLLEKAGCDILFLPSVAEMYSDGAGDLPHYEIGYLETVLEGAYRPGHFQGVCQVVHRLLDIVIPRKLFMGQKDYQQCMVIRKLLALTGSNTELIISETLREPDGLAMSSRNMRLNEDERKLATGIFEALSFINVHIQPGDLSALLSKAREILLEKGLQPDYIVVADAGNLQVIDTWNGATPIVALAAAYMGKIRLIDNLILRLNFA
ncbi:MAG: pantoate--beta-alanine ligase [Chitinophagaceae bacterium]|nr:pantoate--beta-alanine ligase [Chitinophagaceae bacterium]MCW5928469.1 pantoate--beta-alanine ligase [Chitinophagaceae bacterium]